MTAAPTSASRPNACAPRVISGGNWTNGSSNTIIANSDRMSSRRSTTMVESVRDALTFSSLARSTSLTNSPARPGSTLLAR